MSTTMITPEVLQYKVLHLFAGLGGAALGFQRAEIKYKGLRGKFQTLAGIDCDEDACKDFEKLTGAPGIVMDLFTREQYEAFHGHEPPKSWREVVPEELRFICNDQFPDVVFLSPPCKGFSSLLPKKAAESAKYQALNRLVPRGLKLVLQAFRGRLPKLILLENVPRITQRGGHLLKEIKELLGQHGYVFHEATHCCGEIGGLGQRRKRYLLVARHQQSLPCFIYQPPRRKLRSIGDVIGSLPMPSDPMMGPLHRLPNLQWKTWVRLSRIPAGGDWRDLQEFSPQDLEARKRWERAGEKTEGEVHLFKGKYTVMPFNEPSRTVIGGSSNGACYVADVRLGYRPGINAYSYGVQPWNEPAFTVTGNMRISGSSPTCVADPRVSDKMAKGWDWRDKPGLYGVQDWNMPAQTVTGSASVTGSNYPAAVADPRLGRYRAGMSSVLDWNEPSPTISGHARVTGSNCPAAIADPRFNLNPKSPKFNHAYKMSPWDEPAPTIAGGTGPSSGAICVADKRVKGSDNWGNSGIMEVQPWGMPSKTVTGSLDIHAGAAAVADPRPEEGKVKFSNKYQMLNWDRPATTVTGTHDIQSGAQSVADKRVPKEAGSPDMPPIIIAADGTWHRPLTTLELAALQGLPVWLHDGTPLVLAGKSDARWRERIGNAVPPDSAENIAKEVLRAMIGSYLGEIMLASNTDIWVKAPKGRNAWVGRYIQAMKDKKTVRVA